MHDLYNNNNNNNNNNSNDTDNIYIYKYGKDCRILKGITMMMIRSTDEDMHRIKPRQYFCLLSSFCWITTEGSLSTNNSNIYETTQESKYRYIHRCIIIHSLVITFTWIGWDPLHCYSENSVTIQHTMMIFLLVLHLSHQVVIMMHDSIFCWRSDTSIGEGLSLCQATIRYTSHVQRSN